MEKQIKANMTLNQIIEREVKGKTLSFEQLLGILHTMFAHSTRDDFQKLAKIILGDRSDMLEDK